MTSRTIKQSHPNPPAHQSRQQARAEARARAKRKDSFGRRWGPWIGVAGLLALGIAIWVTGNKPQGGAVANTIAATTFTLPATDGSQISLSDYKGQNVLLYFNEGVGCDACFYQMTSLETDSKVLSDAGITNVLPIVVNPMADAQAAVARFDLKNPWLIDGDKRVSDAYHMLGTGMHEGLPGHGFVLINAQGHIVWTMNYPSMYASAKQIVGDVGSALQRS
jgi:peroxiredoxin